MRRIRHDKCYYFFWVNMLDILGSNRCTVCQTHNTVEIKVKKKGANRQLICDACEFAFVIFPCVITVPTLKQAEYFIYRHEYVYTTAVCSDGMSCGMVLLSRARTPRSWLSWLPDLHC